MKANITLVDHRHQGQDEGRQWATMEANGQQPGATNLNIDYGQYQD